MNVGTTDEGQADFGRLRRGDLLFYKGADKLHNFVYARKFSHTGIYDGPNSLGQPQVYESNAYNNEEDTDGGPKLINMNNYWTTNEDRCIALARFDPYLIPQELVEEALDNRQQLYGVNGETPYPDETPSEIISYWPNKEQNDKLYCPLVPWKVFDVMDIDIDSNDLRYRVWFTLHWAWFVTGVGAWEAGNLIVAPDEIYLHDNIILYSEGVNPP
ncbi:MAG: hypothetical protein R2867_15555 [Caldilineaceae bacterium]